MELFSEGGRGYMLYKAVGRRVKRRFTRHCKYDFRNCTQDNLLTLQMAEGYKIKLSVTG
jgi:hypothetical protein